MKTIIITVLKPKAVKTNITEIENKIKNTSEWTITVMCPSPGAIIVINSAFVNPIFTYRKSTEGYKLDKELAYDDAAKKALKVMIDAHNASVENQNEAEKFEL